MFHFSKYSTRKTSVANWAVVRFLSFTIFWKSSFTFSHYSKRAVPAILSLLGMYQHLTLNIRCCFLFHLFHVRLYLCNVKYIIHPSIWAVNVGFTFLNLRMVVYSAAFVSWMDRELTDLWIPVPPFPLPAPLLMVSLPLPLPRPPWVESKRVSKAVKSYVFFSCCCWWKQLLCPSYSFSFLAPANTGCCSAAWKSSEETSVKAHLSRQPFLGGGGGSLCCHSVRL